VDNGFAIKIGKRTDDQRLDVTPGESAVTCAEGRNGDGFDAARFDFLSESDKALLDPFETRRVAPMLLRCKVDDEAGSEHVMPLGYEQFSRSEIPSLAECLISLEVLRIGLLEH